MQVWVTRPVAPPRLLLRHTQLLSPTQHRGSVCPPCPPMAPPYATWLTSGPVHRGGTERNTSPQTLWVLHRSSDCTREACGSGVSLVPGAGIDPVYWLLTTLLVKAQASVSEKSVSDWKRIRLCVGVFTPSSFLFLWGNSCSSSCFYALCLDKGAAACLCVPQMCAASPRGHGANPLTTGLKVFKRLFQLGTNSAAWWQSFWLHIYCNCCLRFVGLIMLCFTYFFVCSITWRMEESVCWRMDCRSFTAREFCPTGRSSDFNTQTDSYCYCLWGCKTWIVCSGKENFERQHSAELNRWWYSLLMCKVCSVPVSTGLLTNHLKIY